MHGFLLGNALSTHPPAGEQVAAKPTRSEESLPVESTYEKYDGSVAERGLTDFEHVLLGWIAMGPQSAYDLKKLFSATLASVDQPSQGALVPALHRLEGRGLLDVEPRGALGRCPRRVYHLTPSGRAAYLAWLRQPVDPATVRRDLGLHLVRFVMMEHELSESEILGFLADLADALEGFVDSIERYVASTPLRDRHPLLLRRHLATGVIV